MTDSAQSRATRNYRRRLKHRGLARFEVQARETDRDLIRALARRLAGEGSEAARAQVQEIVRGEPQAAVLQAQAASPAASHRSTTGPR